jgi:hypothetical protein
MPKIVSWLDPQERHNRSFMPPRPERVADEATLEASLIAKNGPSGEPPPPEALVRKRPSQKRPPPKTYFDPIASALARHPGLTSAEAAEMAESFGF